MAELELAREIAACTFVHYIKLVEKVKSFPVRNGQDWQSLLLPAEAQTEIRNALWQQLTDQRDCLERHSPQSRLVFKTFNYVLECFNAKTRMMIEYLGPELLSRLEAGDNLEIADFLVGLSRLVQILLDLSVVRWHESHGMVVLDNQTDGRLPVYAVTGIEDVLLLRRLYG